MENKHLEDLTPSSGKNHLVEKVKSGNLNCDSPFKLLPKISTPPSRIFKIRNPFESPLIERLHLPVCSPGLFTKSTPKKDEKFIWSICDISNLKPAEIDTNCYQESISTTLDPQTESVIQDKISSFFRHNAVVPSPAPRGTNETKHHYAISKDDNGQKEASIIIRKSNTEVSDSTSSVASEMDIQSISQEKVQYLSEEDYYKKLFEFGPQTPDKSAPISLPDSPVEFSPLQILEVKSFSDEMDKKSFNECIISPITTENKTFRRETSKNTSRDSKPVCRLVFSDKGSTDEEKDVDSFNDSDLYRELPLEDTVTESDFFRHNISDENLGIMSIDEVFQEGDVEKMDISLIHTPKTGLYSSPRKRLSDSFKDVHTSFSQMEEISEVNTNNTVAKSGCLSEGSSDLGYHSANVLTGPSMTENTWNSSHVFSSTPTKRKNV